LEGEFTGQCFTPLWKARGAKSVQDFVANPVLEFEELKALKASNFKPKKTSEYQAQKAKVLENRQNSSRN
jgi:hypothetical protein